MLLPAMKRAAPASQTAIPSCPHGSSVTQQCRSSTGSGTSPGRCSATYSDGLVRVVVEPDGEVVVARQRVAVGAVPCVLQARQLRRRRVAQREREAHVGRDADRQSTRAASAARVAPGADDHAVEARRPAAGADRRRRGYRDDLVGHDPVAERGGERGDRGARADHAAVVVEQRRLALPEQGVRGDRADAHAGLAHAAPARRSAAGPSRTAPSPEHELDPEPLLPLAPDARASTASATSRGSSCAWRKIRDSPPDCAAPGAPRS